MTDVVAKLADGTELRFPAGTADDVIDRVVQTHLTKPENQVPVVEAPQVQAPIEPQIGAEGNLTPQETPATQPTKYFQGKSEAPGDTSIADFLAHPIDTLTGRDKVSDQSLSDLVTGQEPSGGNHPFLGATAKGIMNFKSMMNDNFISEILPLIEDHKKQYGPNYEKATPEQRKDFINSENELALHLNKQAQYNKDVEAVTKKYGTNDFSKKADSLYSKPEFQNASTLHKFQMYGDLVLSNPQDIPGHIATVSLESLPTSLTSIVAATMANFMKLGPSGAAYAGGSTSGLTEFASQYVAMRQEGLSHEEATMKAGVKSTFIGNMDARSFNSAGKALDRIMGQVDKGIVKRVLSTAKETAKELNKQGMYGTAGEVLGSIASGQKVDPRAALDEYFGELATGPLEALTTYRGKLADERAAGAEPAPPGGGAPPGSGTPPPTTKTPQPNVVTPETLLTHVETRLKELTEKANGVPAQETVDENGNKITIPEQGAQPMTEQEIFELKFLQEHQANPEELAKSYGVNLATKGAIDETKEFDTEDLGIEEPETEVKATTPSTNQQVKKINDEADEDADPVKVIKQPRLPKSSFTAPTLLGALKRLGGVTMKDKLDVSGERKGFAPGGYNAIFTNKTEKGLMNHIESGSLDRFLPPDIRLQGGIHEATGQAYDPGPAYEFLATKIRNGEKVLSFEVQEEINDNQQYQEDNATLSTDIDEISQLEEEFINEQLRIAINEDKQTTEETKQPVSKVENRAPISSAPAEALTLEGQTNEEIAQQEAAKKAAEDLQTQEQAKLTEAERQAKINEEIKQRSEGAADTFELGQTADQNLTGQGEIFGEGVNAGQIKTLARKLLKDGALTEAQVAKYDQALSDPAANPQTVMDDLTNDVQINEQDVRDLGPMYEKIKAKPGANVGRISAMLGPQLYGSLKNIQEVSVKEMVQNSFDAIKTMIEKGIIDRGNISINVNVNDRSITIKDNGSGMSPDILQNTFFTIAGTNKETEFGSGAFGIAKMLFLYNNQNVEVTTMRDGTISHFVASGEQLKASLDDPSQSPEFDTYDANQYNKTELREDFPQGHGTIITVVVPKTYTDPSTGKTEDIPFIEEKYEFPVLMYSPLFRNIEVRFNGENIYIGSSFPKEDYTTFVNADFDWGTARIYVSTKERDKYGKNVHILSNGLWQFSEPLTKKPGDKYADNIPYRFYIDIVSKAKPEEQGYPFTFNRQNLTKEANADLELIKNYLWLTYTKKDLVNTSTSFGNVHYLSKKKGIIKVSAKENLNPEIKVQETPDGIKEGSNVKVVDGQLIVNGKPIPALSTQDLKNATIDLDELKIPQDEINSDDIMVHDNLNIEYKGNFKPITELAKEKFGERFDSFMYEIGDVFKTLRDRVVYLNIKGELPNYDDIGYKDLANHAIGISFDKEYRGVSIKLPFDGMFINPALPEFKDPERAGFGLFGTMIHELAHYQVRNHEEEFPAEMQRLSIVLKGDKGFDLNGLEQELVKSVIKNKDILDYLNDLGVNYETEAIGQRFKDSEYERATRRTSQNISEPGGAGQLGRKVPSNIKSRDQVARQMQQSQSVPPTNQRAQTNIEDQLPPITLTTNQLLRRIARDNFAFEEEIEKKPSLRIELKRLQKALQESVISYEEYANDITSLLEATKKEPDTKERVRGAEHIKSKLLVAMRKKELSPEAVKLAIFFIDKNPALFKGLGISIKAKTGEDVVSGFYEPTNRIANIMKYSTQDLTTIHEFLHDMERMLPKDIQSEIRKAWINSLVKAAKAAQKDGDLVLNKYYENLLDYHTTGNTDAKDVVKRMIANKEIKSEHYAHYNPSEFWAVNASKLIQNRFNSQQSIINRLKQWLKEFIQVAKGAIGLDSQAPLIKALSSLAKSDGEFKTSEMIYEGGELENIELQKAQTDTPAFKKWFGKSKIVNADGTPKLMYHGTAHDISEFITNYIFVTPDPELANDFTKYSAGRIMRQIAKGIDANPSEKLKLITKAVDDAIANKKLGTKENSNGMFDGTREGYIKSFMDKPFIEAADSTALRKPLTEELQNRMQTGRNIMPVYVKAENPFDFENISHVKKIQTKLFDKFKYHKIKEGDWEAIESDDVQDAIKSLGFDSFYTKENGEKQLAVFNSNQIKSATGNKGTYDSTSNILYNIEEPDESDRLESVFQAFNVPETTPHDPKTTKEMVDDSVEGIKKAITNYKQDPKAARIKMIGAMDTAITKFQNGYLFFGSALEKTEARLNQGSLRLANNTAVASAFLTQAIHAGHMASQVMMRGKLVFNEAAQWFEAADSEFSMKNVMTIEHNLYKKVGKKVAAKLINTYFEAKRARSIQNEFLEREAERQRSIDAKEDPEVAQRNYEAIKKAYDKIPDYLRQHGADGKTLYQEIRDTQGKVIERIPILSDEAIDTFIDQDNQHPELRDMMDNWTAVNHNMLDMMVFGGVISRARANKLKAIKDYVPWFRVQDDSEELHAPSGAVAALTNVSKERKFKKGETAKQIDNIVDNMINNILMMTRNSVRNYAMLQVTKNFATRKENGRIAVFPSEGFSPDGAVRTNVVANGRRIIIEFKDPLIADSVLGLPNLDIPMIGVFSAFQQFGRRSITLNPVFQAWQVIKDAPTAAAVTGLKNPYKAVGQILLSFFKALLPNDPIVKILKSRGVGGFQFAGRTAEKEVKLEMGVLGHKIWPSILKVLDHIGDASDYAQRRIIYQEVLKDTGDELQATWAANNVIDFMRRGNSRLALAEVRSVAFMGAYANQLDVLMTAIAGGGFRGPSRLKAMAKFAAITAAFSAAVIVYCMLKGDDDDYKDLDDQTKLRHWIIGGTKIPMSTSYSFFYKSIVESSFNYIVSQGTKSEVDDARYRRMLKRAALDSLLGPNPIPNLLKSPVEIITNHNFFTGGTVTPRNLENLDTFMQYTRNTSELGKWISHISLGALSPIESDHLVRGWSGTIGALTMWGSDLFTNDKPEKVWAQNPVIGQLFLQPEAHGREDLFYDLKEESDKYFNTWTKLRERRRVAEAKEYFKEHKPYIIIHDNITGADQALKSINAEMRRISDLPAAKMSSDVKLKRLTKFQQEKNSILKNITILRAKAGR